MVFDPKLSEVQLSQSPTGGGASVGAAVVSGVANLGVAIAGLVGTVRDSKAIAGFQGELDVIGKETSAFTKEFKRLGDELEESSDKAEISNLHDQLTALQRGKTQFGDRATFRTKAGVVLKKFIAANPHLADEGASLFGASSFGSGVGPAGAVDPGVSTLEQEVAKEVEQVTQIMVALNISRPQARAQFDHSKILASKIQQGAQEVTLAAQNRVSVFQGMLKVTSAGAAMAVKTVMQQVLETIANPDLTFDIVTSLGIYDQQVNLIRSQRQAILLNSGNAVLNAKELKDLEDITASNRANLEGLLNSKDPIAAIKRQAERQAVIDVDIFNNLITSTFGDGETSTLIRLMGNVNAATFMMTVLPLVITSAQGKTPEVIRLMIRAALELGETHKAAALALVLDGNIGGVYSELAKATGEIRNPPAEVGDESTESFMASFTGWLSGVMLSKETPPDTDEKIVKPLITSTFTSGTITSIANLMTPGALAAVLQKPALIKHANNLVNRQLFDMMGSMQASLPQDLEIVIDKRALEEGVTNGGKPKTLFRLRKVGSTIDLAKSPRIPIVPGLDNLKISKLVKDLDYLSALAGYRALLNQSSKRDTLKWMEESLFALGGTPTELKEKAKGFQQLEAEARQAGDVGRDIPIIPLSKEDEASLEETPEVKNKKPFSFLSTATTSELVTLAADAKDEPLLKAIEEERERRGVN